MGVSRTPVVVIGVDGADPRLIRKGIQGGYLSNIGELADEGSGVDTLLSTPNAMSSSAWITFRTGLSPGQHGIFYFLDKVPGAYRIHHSTKRIPTLKSFWNYAGERGKRVASLYMPLSYPADDLNGIQVTCWLTPSLQSKGATHPPSLVQEIMEGVPEFKIHWPFRELIQKGRYREALESKLRSIDAKHKLARMLLQDKDWDLILIGFEELDNLQHFFWHFSDESHPKYPKSAQNDLNEAILKGYIAIDRVIGDVRGMFGPNARYILLSDHGFRANTYGHLFVSDFLGKAGYQAERKSLLGRISKHSYGIAELMPTKFKYLLDSLWPRMREGVLEKRCFDHIEMGATQAYSIYLNRTSEIWINMRGRDPHGVVPPEAYDKLCSELEGLLLGCKEIKTGRHPIRSVLKKEDIYAGKYIDYAPDLTLKWHEDVFVNGLICKLGGAEVIAQHPIEHDLRTGDHADRGIFIDSGMKNVKKQQVEMDMIDMAPHVLNALGVEVPQWMQGSSYQRQEEEASKEKNIPGPEMDRAPQFSDHEKQQIEDILKEVGYL